MELLRQQKKIQKQKKFMHCDVCAKYMCRQGKEEGREAQYGSQRANMVMDGGRAGHSTDRQMPDPLNSRRRYHAFHRLSQDHITARLHTNRPRRLILLYNACLQQ